MNRLSFNAAESFPFAIKGTFSTINLPLFFLSVHFHSPSQNLNFMFWTANIFSFALRREKCKRKLEIDSFSLNISRWDYHFLFHLAIGSIPNEFFTLFKEKVFSSFFVLCENPRSRALSHGSNAFTIKTLSVHSERRSILMLWTCNLCLCLYIYVCVCVCVFALCTLVFDFRTGTRRTQFEEMKYR